MLYNIYIIKYLYGSINWKIKRAYDTVHRLTRMQNNRST